MEVYEVVVKALVTQTFKVIAVDQREAAVMANRMFSNENMLCVFALKLDVHNSQEPVRYPFKGRNTRSSETPVV